MGERLDQPFDDGLGGNTSRVEVSRNQTLFPVERVDIQHTAIVRAGLSDTGLSLKMAGTAARQAAHRQGVRVRKGACIVRTSDTSTSCQRKRLG